MVIGSDDGLSTLFRSCVFSCRQRVLKTLPGPGYHHSKDGIVWLWHFLVNLYVYRSSVYLATAQSQYLMVIGRDGGLSTLCHSCRFACQQRVLKTFSHLVYFHSEDGVVWLWHFLVNLDIYSSPFYHTTAQSQYVMVIGRDGALNTVCQSCRFSCQQKVLKTFSGPDYLRPRMSGLPMAFRGKFG